MTETEKLEALLEAEGEGEVRLVRRDAYDILQKLRARGGQSEATVQLESQLAHGEDVVLARAEAQSLLEELRASGRRWVFGSDMPPERAAHTKPKPAPAPLPEPEPERQPEPESELEQPPEPEPEPQREPEAERPPPGFFRRLWRR